MSNKNMLRFLLKTLAFAGIVQIALRIIGATDNLNVGSSLNQNIKRLQLAAQFLLSQEELFTHH